MAAPAVCGRDRGTQRRRPVCGPDGLCFQVRREGARRRRSALLALRPNICAPPPRQQNLLLGPVPRKGKAGAASFCTQDGRVMAELPFMPLAVESWDADTSHLSDAEDGIYGRIIRIMWKSPAQRIPNDDAWIARRMRRTVEDVVRDVRPIIVEFCQNDGNWITHKRVDREWNRAKKLSVSRSVSAKSRWNKEKEACERSTSSHQVRNAPTPTPTPTPSKKEKDPPPPTGSPPPQGNAWDLLAGVMVERAAKKRTPRKATAPREPCPPDWQPSANMHDTLTAKGYSPHEVDWQRDRFAAYWSARGDKRPGWDASFFQWVTRDPPGKNDPARIRPGNGSSGQGIVAGVSALLASYRNVDGDR